MADYKKKYPQIKARKRQEADSKIADAPRKTRSQRKGEKDEEPEDEVEDVEEEVGRKTRSKGKGKATSPTKKEEHEKKVDKRKTRSTTKEDSGEEEEVEIGLKEVEKLNGKRKTRAGEEEEKDTKAKGKHSDPPQTSILLNCYIYYLPSYLLKFFYWDIEKTPNKPLPLKISPPSTSPSSLTSPPSSSDRKRVVFSPSNITLYFDFHESVSAVAEAAKQLKGSKKTEDEVENKKESKQQKRESADQVQTREPSKRLKKATDILPPSDSTTTTTTTTTEVFLFNYKWLI